MSLSIAEQSPDRSWLVNHVLPPVFCVLLSLLVVSTASSLVMQAGFLDPYVYAGYVNDYFGTFQRYGHTYYSSRIAYILLDRAFLLAFGQDAGLFLCRLCVLTCATFATFKIAERYFGFAVGIISACWLCLVPWLLRSIAWTHYDGFATVYALIALAFLLVPQRRRFLGHAVAGFFLALSVNCNLHLLVVAGTFAPSWIWLNRDIGIRRVLGLILAIALGFIASYAMLQTLFTLATGGAKVFVEAAAFNSARELLGGQMANWFHTLGNNISVGNFIFLLPIFFSVAAIFATAVNWSALSRPQRDFCVATLLYVVLLTIAVFCLHFLQHGWLSLFYYQVYQLPSCLLAFIAIAGIASVRTPRLFRVVCINAPLILAAVWFARHLTDATLPNDIYIWAGLGAVTFVIALLRRKTSAIALLLSLMLATNLMFIWQQGVGYRHYAFWPGLKSTTELQRSVYGGAVFLQKFVRAKLLPTTPVGFWYSNSRDVVNFNSMQSMFLWGYSRVQGFTGPGMPEVDDFLRKAIQQKRFLVLMARDEEELDRAYAALKTVPINFVEIARANYAAPVESYRVTMVELSPILPSIGERLGEAPLQSILVQNGGAAISGADGLNLATPTCQWCYAATVPLELLQSDAIHDLVIRIKLIVSEGQLGIATTTKANPSALQNVNSAGAGITEQAIDIMIPSLGKDALLVLRNDAASGVSRATIKSIEYHREK